MFQRIFAENISVSNDTRKTHLNNNDLIIGTTGAGKTGSYIVPNLRITEESFVVTDTKSNLYGMFRDQLTERGYQVHHIDLINLKGAYNPLKYVRKVKKGGKWRYSDIDIRSIAHILTWGQSKQEPFWEMQASNVIAMLISFVLLEFEEKEKTLAAVSDCFRLMSMSMKTDAANGRKVQFLEEHVLKYPDSLASRNYMMLKSGAESEKTMSSIFLFVSNALAVFDTEEARALLTRKSDFRIEDLGRRKTALFLNVSDHDRSLDPIVNLLYTQIFACLCREADRQADSRLKVPVRIIMDDFATNTKIPDFDKLIAVIRSREISVTLILQNLSQLESVYSASQKWTIVNNCDTIYYIGGTDLSTVNYIAERCNLSPQEVMGLPYDQGYFLQRGMKTGKIVRKLTPYAMPAPLLISSDDIGLCPVADV